jgi:hypothetical protein
VVGRVLPFQSTVEELMKLLPVTASANVAVPATTLAGISAEMAGSGLLAFTAKLAAFEVPPPGPGVTTVMLAVEALATSSAGTWAVSDVEELKVVGSGVPFQSIVDELMKLLPVTTSEKVAVPAITLEGEREEIAGTGFTAVMANVAAPEVPPPGAGVTTVMLAVPAALTSDAGTCATSWVAEPYVVGRATPFQLTTDVPTKPVPSTVSENELEPAWTLLGASEDMVASGLL